MKQKYFLILPLIIFSIYWQVPSTNAQTPTFSTSPASGQQLTTTFSYIAKNLTPNGQIEQYERTPDGNTVRFGTTAATSAGQLSWSYTYSCTDKPGTHYVWIRDVSKNFTTPEVTNNVSANSSCTAPTITSISPASPVATKGNQNVVVNGSNFQSGLTVTAFFPNGGNAILSGAQIINVTSTSFTMLFDFNGNSGSYSIRVNNPNGQQSNTFNFTAQAQVVAPAITSISPASPVATQGNQNVVVNGSNFQSGLTVTMFFPQGGSGTLSGTQITNLTSTSFTMIANLNGISGSYSIRVNNPNGQQSNTFSFTAQPQAVAPTIASISPISPIATVGNQNVVVNGSNFQSGLTVTAFFPNGGNAILSGAQIINVTSTSFTMLFDFNGNPGSYSIRVNNPNGQQSNTFNFTAQAQVVAPTITSISPASPVATKGNQNVVVNGSNFQSGLTVTAFFPNGGNAILSGAQIINVTSTSFTMLFDFNGNPGSYSIRVNNPNGQQSNTFSFTAQSQAVAPTISSLSPSSPVATVGNQNIVVNGSNFQSGLTVTMFFPQGGSGTLSGTQVTNLTSTSFTMIANLNGISGSYSIRVNNPNGQQSNTFSFTAQPQAVAPTIASISPASPVATQGNQNVVVNGSNFQSGLTVSLLNSAGNVVGSLSGSQIQGLTSASFTMVINFNGNPGSYSLRVNNPNGISSSQFPFTVRQSTGTPVANFVFTPSVPLVDQTVQFSDTSSGSSLQYSWDFESDGKVDSNQKNPTNAFKAAGPYKVTLTVKNDYGANTITKTVNIAISNSATSPYITEVARKYPGYFLKGIDLDNPFDVSVDWQGTPGTVRFSINNGASIIETGTVKGATHVFKMGQDFSPSFTASKVAITPINGEGRSGDSWTEYVYVFPYPDWLSVALSKSSYTGDRPIFSVGNGEVKAKFIFDFPDPHLAPNGPITIPEWVPYIGGKFGIRETYAAFEGEVSSKGEGQVTLLGKTGFEAAGQSLDGKVTGSGKFRIGHPNGLEFTGASFSLSLDGKIKKDYGLFDAIPALKTSTAFKPFKWLNDRVTLEGTVNPSLGFTASFVQKDGSLRFDEGTSDIGLGLEAVLKPRIIDRIKIEAGVRGDGTVTVGVPDPFMRELKLGIKAWVKANLDYRFNIKWLGQIGDEKSTEITYNYLCSWKNGQTVNCQGGDAGPNSKPPQVTGHTNEAVSLGVSLISPDYASFGPYSIMPRSGSENKPEAQEVEGLPLVTNIFPGASPNIIGFDNNKLLLWEHQNPAIPVLQSTDIAWSLYDGNTWSQPAFIKQDTQSDHSPVAGLDSAGRIVAAWLRVKDAAFAAQITSTADLPLYYKRFEVVSSVYDPKNKAWGPITQITEDNAFDNNLRLTSDGSGKLILSWLSNPDGEFISTQASPSILKYCNWNGSNWSAPSAIASNLVGASAHALATKNNKAFAIIARDPNLDATNDSLLDLYTWNGLQWNTNGTFAGGAIDNRLPSIAYDSAAEGHVVWLRGNDFVEATLTNPTPRTIRPGSTSLAFYDAKLLSSPQGNLSLLWQQSTDGKPANIFGIIYDPATQTWSSDLRLEDNSNALSQDVSAYYDSKGVINAAFISTQIDRVSEVITIGGQSQIINNIPRLKQSDLRILQRSLIKDISMNDSDISITPAKPQLGNPVNITAVIHNNGDFAVGNFRVGVYSLDSSLQEQLLASTVVTGLIMAGTSRTLSFSLPYPATEGNFIVKADIDNAISEFSETNNSGVIHLTNRKPSAGIRASVTSGSAPLIVEFDSSESADPDDDPISPTWILPVIPQVINSKKTSYTFTRPGTFLVALVITDSKGATDTAFVNISVSPNLGYESDVTPRPTGKRSGSITISDWVQMGRFVAGLDTPEVGSEFQRADSAPRATLGDGRLTLADWAQAGRYAAGLDPVVTAGGALVPVTTALLPSVETVSREVKAVDTQWQRGKINSLQIAMDAKGDENGLAFSLNYDPQMMTFLDVSLGSDATGASLQVNASKAANGLVGIIIILPAGQQFAVGARNLVNLQFIPNGGDGKTNSIIGFSDQSIVRELVDTNAAPIGNVIYTGVTLAITGKAVATVSAASYVYGQQATESIVSAFGLQLSRFTQAAPSLPLPVLLGGSQVLVKDSKGVERFAPLFFVSPTQINYQIPAGTADGIATVTITNGLGESTAGLLNIARVAPGLFAADASGKGWAAAEAVTVASNGAQVSSPVARFDAGQSKFIAVPIDVSSGTAVLVLYGTGLRQRSALANVKVKVGGLDVPLDFAGAQPNYVGLDQVNVRLPKALAGRGEVFVEVTVDGKAANPVRVQIR